MPKTIQTFLGPVVVRTQKISGRSGKVSITFQRRAGLATLHARRIASAQEPNTYVWSLSGVPGFPPMQIIAPSCAEAIHSYLAQMQAEPTTAQRNRNR